MRPRRTGTCLAAARARWQLGRPSSSPSRPGRRPTTPALRAGSTPIACVNGRVPARRHRVAAVVRRAGRRAGRRPQRPRARPRRAQAGRPAARRRGVQRRVRPGPHVRQPLRVLLHLPAAEGPAAQPVPEGRRLPAELPVRELHDADPVHRGRPRAGGHRAAVAAARQHPHHRPRAAGARCCATRAAPPACAGCAPCSTTASRCAARSSCVPASTTAGARRHVRRRARRVPRAVVGRRRAARRLPVQPRAGDARRTPPPRRPPSSTPSRTGRTCTAPRSAAAWCTPPTSTT